MHNVHLFEFVYSISVHICFVCVHTNHKQICTHIFMYIDRQTYASNECKHVKLLVYHWHVSACLDTYVEQNELPAKLLDYFWVSFDFNVSYSSCWGYRNTLQHTFLQHSLPLPVVTLCNTLQHNATHCSTRSYSNPAVTGAHSVQTRSHCTISLQYTLCCSENVCRNAGVVG